MPSVLFTNALMLAGMAALVIPVLIHLLLKRKLKRLPFSTVQFFQKQDEQSSRRRKLRNWLLLALRLLLVTLLVAAFARPYLRGSQSSAGARQKQRVVFVLDASASLLATGTDGQRWAQAKKRMQKVISDLKPDDSAALIACSTHAEVLSGFAPPQSLSKTLAGLRPSYTVSDLAEGMRQALKLISSGERNTRATIFVVSDLQRSACRGLAGCPISQDLDVKLLAVGDLHSPNLAITEFETEPRAGVRPHLAVTSFSDEDSSNIKLGVSVDGKEVFSRNLELKAGTSTNVDFLVPPLRSGWHEATASLQSKDSFELDNTRYAALFIPEPSRVFLIESQPTKRVFEQESFFLAAALDPSKGSTNSVPGAFNLVQMSAEELVTKLSASRGQSPCDLVILPGLREFPAGAALALKSFAQAGGGVVLFLNEEISANRYNSELGDLLPAKLGTMEATPDTGASWRLGEHDTNTVIFGAFRLPNSGNLQLPEFRKRFALTPVGGTAALALFDDDAPLILARRLGRGQIVLVNTSADTSWSDWPKHKTFVPWLHGLGKYLAQRAGSELSQQTNNFVAGQDFQLEAGAGAKNSQLTLRGPEGHETVVSCDEQGRLLDAPLTTPGIHSLRDKTGKELRRLAVNPPAQESDLEALAPADFQQQLTRIQETSKPALAASLFGSASRDKEFWSALLMGALLLLLIEPFVANRTSA